MQHFRDVRPSLPWTGMAILVCALFLFVAGPTAGASGPSRALTSDALYQPVPFGNVASFDTSNVAYDFPVVAMLSTPDAGGYWLVAADGGVFSFGNAAFFGSAAPLRLNRPIVGMAATRDGKGYWLAAADGGVFSFGDAQFYGSLGTTHLDKPVVAMAATPDGKGYWLVAADGGVFSFGDAQFYGSLGTTHLDKPVVAMAATPDGKGYWLVAADGGVFSFGDAQFYGSLGTTHLNKPVVAMAATPDGKGYWLVAADGGVFSFGDAQFYGSLGGRQITYPIAGMAIDPDGGGYWLLPTTTLPTATLGTWTGIEPTLMQFSGDAGNIVTNLAWSSWNNQSAVGEGTWGYDNCTPDCAQGVVKDYPATITLTNPSDGRFTELTEDQSGPVGHTFVFALPGPSFRASS